MHPTTQHPHYLRDTTRIDALASSVRIRAARAHRSSNQYRPFGDSETSLSLFLSHLTPAPNQSCEVAAVPLHTHPLPTMAEAAAGGGGGGGGGGREQDRYLPVANIARIMKKALPPSAKIAKDAKEAVQECVSEFVSFVTSE
jgi:hypothetical protein